MNKDQLLSLTLRQLRQEASKLSVPLYSRKTKAVLVDLILKYQEKSTKKTYITSPHSKSEETVESNAFNSSEEVKTNAKVGNIGSAIQGYVEQNGFSVVRELVGHGIGRKLHEEPQVPNFGNYNQGPVIENGLCIAIEPMVNMGSFEVFTKNDNWTISTADGLPSAHFEHSIAFFDDKVKILTIIFLTMLTLDIQN